MQEFPGNAHKAKARSEVPQQVSPKEEKIEQITSGQVTRRKRSLGKNFKETFIGGSARSAVEYMAMEVIVPAIQDTLIVAFQEGVERLIKGEGPRSRRRSPSLSPYENGPPRVDYSKFTGSQKPPEPRRLSRQARARGSFDDILIPTLPEANDVLDRLFEILDRRGSVQVAVLYELTGIQASHTDFKWGWTSLQGARASRHRSGAYLLDLPEPEELG